MNNITKTHFLTQCGLLTLALVLSFVSCNSPLYKNSSSTDSTNSSVLPTANKKSIRFFPDKKSVEEFDTVIADRRLEITITKTHLDSFVTREDYDQYIDRYRDAEISLVIKQNDQILLDTTFRKEQFSKYADKGLMNIAIFQHYGLSRLDNDKIEFVGSICEPETDHGLDFSHYFNLTNRKLEFIERKNDVEYSD